ncbi:hypothetical protein BGZ95_003318 [Linnemannia exigua]|uniref:WD40 repeat-like protein n=1 Tax=Linnemannia exigua TaxID=604196 RepID=A0AAD4H2T9_9FUNG|nr:hypothetical protein BGZ95_003318 [Linnemannia exigua]
MATNPTNQSHQHTIGNSSKTDHATKRDKFRALFGLKSKASNKSLNTQRSTQVSTQAAAPSHVALHTVDSSTGETISTPIAQVARNSSIPPAMITKYTNFFPENLSKPAIKTVLPTPQDRIHSTKQLVYCNALLLQGSSSTTDKQELDWIATMDKNPVAQDHLRSLTTSMVQVFVQDGLKESTEIAEMVALGPVLNREFFRKLLSNILKELDESRILDFALLQGMIQLLQSTPLGYLESDDLIKILSILRTRLEGTHGRSLEHTYYLTLAVSVVLDSMADHEVKDLDRVVEHEPLFGVLSGLRGSSDPYMIYQACYAFQALQYVPDEETVLQAVVRHSTGVANGLVKVAALFTLNLSAVLEGLGELQEVAGGAIMTGMTVYEGYCSVKDNGQGIFDSLKDGYGSGKKRPWYAAIRAANALARAGQLKDLNQLICEAPCGGPMFQWGTCQLLGEIALDAIWDCSTRQQAVDLLGELYKNDREWGQDESVKAWMIEIISQLGTTSDKTISTIALALLEDINQVKQDLDHTSHLWPPLSYNHSFADASPVLAKVQNIPYIEYDLHKVRLQRLQESTQRIYIPPMAKANLQAKDDDLFPLMDKVQEFLASKREVMLILGDSGAGKSTFNSHLETLLWTNYNKGDSIPLYINLPAIERPDLEMITKQLQIYGFKDDHIQEIRRHRQLILICDGYDESQLVVNLYKSNQLNQQDQWRAKMIISCRTQFLGPDYLSRFIPGSMDHYKSARRDLFQEAVIAPFSKEQVKDYVTRYVPLEPRPWITEDYMRMLTTIPHLMDLVRNPFLLTLSLEALPGVTKGRQDLSTIKITRVQLYDHFVDEWLGVNMRRLLDSTLSIEDQSMLDQLIEADFLSMGAEFSVSLALAIFDKNGANPVIQYTQLKDKNTWKMEFFGSQPEARLLRESLPLIRTGSRFRFVHRSVLEYFLSRAIYDPTIFNNEDNHLLADVVPQATQLLDVEGPLFKRNLLDEPSVVQFLCDRAKLDPSFEQQLRAVIYQSKTDSTAIIAATNAITILVKASAPFHGADLRGIEIPGADLSHGQFDSAQFQGANLKEVNLSASWLRQTNMSGARLEDVRFGELPYLEANSTVTFCTYSPDGKMFAMVLDLGRIDIYNTSTWTQTHQLKGDGYRALCVAFSPNSQQMVSGDDGRAVRLWDITNSEEVWARKDHTTWVRSVAFSPCGTQIASTSDDKTVRLWRAQTGEALFVLNGSTRSVISVRYSPDGGYVVSGSNDATIRFWDPATGRPGKVLESSSAVHSLAVSPDGSRLISGHEDGELRVWNAIAEELETIWIGHTKPVTGIAFSPDGQWIASSSQDMTARLWDASEGTLIFSFTSHNDWVNCIAFSPYGGQIASGGYDERVWLLEVDSGLSSFQQEGEVSRVLALAYTSDGGCVLSVDRSGIVSRWDSTTGAAKSFQISLPAPIEIFDCAFSHGGTRLATYIKDGGSIHLWDTRTGAAGPILEGHSNDLFRMTFSPCGRWLAFEDKRNQVHICDLVESSQPRLIDGRGGTSMQFSASGEQIFIGTKDATIRTSDTQTGETLSSDKFTVGSAHLYAYSPNGQQVAVVIKTTSVHLCDTQSIKVQAVLDVPLVRIYSIVYSPCGQWIAIGYNGGLIQLWRREVSKEENWYHATSAQGFFSDVFEMAWNPAVPMEFVTGFRDGSVRVWQLSEVGGNGFVTRLKWCSEVKILCVDGLILENTTGLSPIQQKLLIQRGAVDNTLTPGDDASNAEE